MTILAFLNQKGGTGKTTLSLNVAYGLAQADQRVLLIDADQQASANVWSSLREDQPFSVFAAQGGRAAERTLRLDRHRRDTPRRRYHPLLHHRCRSGHHPHRTLRSVGLGLRPYRWTGGRSPHLSSRPARLLRHLPQDRRHHPRSRDAHARAAPAGAENRNHTASGLCRVDAPGPEHPGIRPSQLGRP